MPRETPIILAASTLVISLLINCCNISLVLGGVITFDIEDNRTIDRLYNDKATDYYYDTGTYMTCVYYRRLIIKIGNRQKYYDSETCQKERNRKKSRANYTRKRNK